MYVAASSSQSVGTQFRVLSMSVSYAFLADSLVDSGLASSVLASDLFEERSKLTLLSIRGYIWPKLIGFSLKNTSSLPISFLCSRSQS